MPSPTKRKISAPVSDKQKITSFFKRAAPQSSSRDAHTMPTSADPQRSPARSLTSELTSLASATPEPKSPLQEANVTPRIIPIITHSNAPRHDPIRSPTRPSAQKALPTASFTSTSSFTSLPYSSSGSSRVRGHDGMMVVTNSDSESDEFPEPDVLMGFKKTAATTQSGTGFSGLATGPKSKNPTMSARLQRQIPATPANPNPNHKNSLAKLRRDREEAERSRARIAEMEASIAKADETLQEMEEQAPRMTSEQLLAMLAGDGDDGGRMKQAIQRTEALNSHQRFEFFSSTQPCAPEFDFPTASLPNESWANLLRDEESRTQACLSGFVAEIGTSGRLPAEVTRWFAVELVRELRSELADAYVTIIQTCVHHKHAVHGSLSALDTYYPCGQAKETQMQSDSQLLGPATQSADTSSEPFFGLSAVVKVIQACAPYAGTDIASRAIADLMLAGIDERISTDMALKLHMENAIEDLVDTLPVQEMEEVTDYLRERFFDDERLTPSIQCQLVLSFPARSIASHNLRRHLAFYCITHEEQSRALSSPNWPKAILSRMTKSSEFHIDDASTDFDLLTRLAAVLDISVDAGFSSAGFPWLGAQATVQPVKTGLFSRIDEQSPAEKAFNTQIDSFTSRVRAIMSRLHESGTVNLGRHEAKAAFENVFTRLQQSVRTRPPPRKGILDGDHEDMRFQRSAMQRFTTKSKEIDEKQATEGAAV